MDFTTTLEHFENSDLWGHHLPVPHEAAAPFVEGKDRRVVATFNGNLELQVALMPDGLGGWFINLNKEVRTKLGVQIGDEVAVTLRKDESKYGLPMPPEFEELLREMPDVNAYFHALTPGKQRNLLYIVGKPKTSATRIKKAVAVANHLLDFEGKLDFRALNDYLKGK